MEQHVGRGEEPGEVDERLQIVQVEVAEHVESAEGKREAAERRPGGVESSTMEEPGHAGEREWVIEEPLGIEGDVDGERGVEQQVERVRHSRLPLSVDVKTAEQVGAPDRALPRG